ncbi:hypothetical protein [Tsukamurella sp. USMM236]|uniref:hypothetical protein n=1 Tax=Tsukamurella sp. USMM236 TaxID=3081301 RepID=UPI00301B6507
MIDRPDTPHADVLLEGIWEDEVTPDDLASRALSAAQASSYAFRVASEGTTATAQLAEVDVSEFLESETGKWAQSFIGIVRVGESLVHVSHALGELARSLQQVNLEQSEIVYQVEAEIEAAQLQSAQAGIDPADRIAELIASARARAAEVAEKMVTPETTGSAKKPAAGLVSGFMAFGRVPGASAEATERNGRVARNGHARNGYAIRNTRADQNGHADANGHGVANGHEAVNGLEAVNGHAGANGQDSVNGHTSAEREVPAPKDAAAAAQDAFADSGDEATMDLGFMSFGRTPASAVPHAGEAATAADGAVDDEPVVENSVEGAAPMSEPLAEEQADLDTPVISNGFLGLGRAPSIAVPADDAAVPVVPQPLLNGFLALGRTPGAGEAAVQGPSSGPIPVAAPTQFLPLPTTPAEIVAGEAGEAEGAEFGAPMTLSGAIAGPLPDREDTTRADAMDDGFLSFGRVPGGGWGGSGVLPTVPTAPEAAPVTASGRERVADEPVADVADSTDVETSPTLDVPDVPDVPDVDDDATDVADERDDDADDLVIGELDDSAADEFDDADDELLEDETDADADADVDFADELDAEADELLAPAEQDEDVLVDVEDDVDETPADENSADDASSEGASADETSSDEASSDQNPPSVDAEGATEEIGTGESAADEPAEVVESGAESVEVAAADEPLEEDVATGASADEAPADEDLAGEVSEDSDEASDGSDEAVADDSDDSDDTDVADDTDELADTDESDDTDEPDDTDELADTEQPDDTDQRDVTDEAVGEGSAEDSGAPVDGETSSAATAETELDEVDEAELDEAETDDVEHDETAPAEPAAAPAEPLRSLAAAAARPVQKSGPVKFSDLLKAANAGKVEPAKMAPVAFVAAAENPVVIPESEPDADAPAALADESATTAELTPSAPTEEAEQPEELKAPAKPAPVLATGPAILGRTEPLVLRKKVSPVVQQVHDAVASILGSLRGGPHGPESGLHWAAGLLVKDAETIMAVTTSDAGWLPPGVVIPAGVRVLWNMPTGYRWASIDDPVRQLIDYAEQDGYTLTAVATTHPSRAYVPVVGEENVVGVLRPGAVLPGGRSRFEATVSPARLQHIRSLDREQAERQARALIRDLETQPIAPEHAIGIEAARIDARCFLDERDEVPPAVLEQLHADERALGDALILDRTPASAEDLTAPAPDAARLRDRMLERAILVATLAAAYHDIESAVYAWTYARFLSSQDQDSEQAR